MRARAITLAVLGVVVLCALFALVKFQNHGVRKEDASFSGDVTAKAALERGDEYARRDDFARAIRWWTISALKGDGIAMQRLAIELSETHCPQAIAWLRGAISSGALKGRSHEHALADLRNLEERCGTTVADEAGR